MKVATNSSILDLSSLVFLAFVFWFSSYAVQWVFVEGGPPPIFSYAGFLAFFFTFLLFRTSHGAPVLTSVTWRRSGGLVVWIAGFCLVTIFSFMNSSQSEIATQRLITTFEMSLILAALTYFMLLEKNRRTVGVAMVFVVLVGATLNIYDFIEPTFSTVPGRAAGMYGNPTLSGFILSLALVIAAIHVPIWLRWPLVGFVAVGIFLTFSRAAWLLSFMSVIWLSWGGYLGGRSTRQMYGLAAFVVFGVLIYGLLTGALFQLVASTSLLQYLDANTMARIGFGVFASDHSANERENVAYFALQAFADGGNPLLGYGLGYTHEWSFPVGTHNMYLLFLVEGGILGLMIYMWLMWVLWQTASGIGMLLTCQIAVFGLFSHNILDNPASLVFIAAIVSGVGANKISSKLYGVRDQQNS